MTIFGRIELSKAHLLNCHKAFKITMYMQSLICMLSQNSVFEEASKVLFQLLRIDLSAKQFQRVSEWYGSQIDSIIQANHIEYIPQLNASKDKEESTYVMMDGSMVFTREDKWKENKLARIFHGSQNIDIQEGRNEIVRSIYVSHLGSIDKFFPKLERHLNLVRTPMVFIADGAKWIWKWVEDNYPGAEQILDYYHAVEKIEYLARLQITDPTKKKDWVEKQKSLLLNDKVDEVIMNIKSLRSRNEAVKKVKGNVVNYYLENEDRMLYASYKKKGLLIGSGPIEAAHRNITQQRLKLSGQRWSIQGANAIANLRCYQKSNAWEIVENLIRLAA